MVLPEITPRKTCYVCLTVTESPCKCGLHRLIYVYISVCIEVCLPHENREWRAMPHGDSGARWWRTLGRSHLYYIPSSEPVRWLFLLLFAAVDGNALGVIVHQFRARGVHQMRFASGNAICTYEYTSTICGDRDGTQT